MLIVLTVYAAVKKVRPYDSFASGAAKALPLIFTVFPYIVAIFIMTELFRQSGASDFIIEKLSPVFAFLGIPKEIAPLAVLKPFSGSGSLALLSDIYAKYGVDGYISRCASAVFGSSETIFYVSAVYFSECKEKKSVRAIVISLVSTFVSTVFACLICRFI